MTFVDTSALIAFLDRDAQEHVAVVAALAAVLADGSATTHNYVVVEAEALVHRRLGAAAARALTQDVLPLADVIWVTPELHAVALAAHHSDMRRRTSFVDHVSFAVMRDRALDEALALDRHFVEAGFRVRP